MRKSILLVASVTLLGSLVVSASWAQKKKKTGTLKLQATDVVLVIKFNSGKKLKVTSKGTSISPGTHFIKSMSFYKKDKKGRTWETRTSDRLGSMQTITIAGGQEKILICGPPYFIRLWGPVKAKKNADISIGLHASGKSAAWYVVAAFLKGKRAPAPAYQITNSAGKVVAKGRCKFSGGSGRIAWNPKGRTGKFTIEVKPNMGPFKWTTAKREIEIE